VPVIYDLVIEGNGIRAVAEYLTVQGVPTTSGKIWHEARIASFIKNPAYKGIRRSGGNLEIEALVSPTKWDEAQLAMASRTTTGRRATTQPKALLRPVCGVCFGVEREGCTDGISPMYRIPRGPTNGRVGVYRCFGHGPQRKSCGAEVPVASLDSAVILMLSRDPRPYTELMFVPGDDHADEISRLRERAMDAYRQGDKAAFRDLDAQADALEQQPSVRAHWKETERDDLTRGQHFLGLDSDAQREYLQRWRPVARLENGRVLVDLDAFTAEHAAGLVLRTDWNTGTAWTVQGDRISVAPEQGPETPGSAPVPLR
jgi:Recombinase